MIYIEYVLRNSMQIRGVKMVLWIALIDVKTLRSTLFICSILKMLS